MTEARAGISRDQFYWLLEEKTPKEAEKGLTRGLDPKLGKGGRGRKQTEREK